MDKGDQADRSQAGDQSQGPRAADPKEILAEVFHARPGEVEEMIQMRLEESRPEEEEREEGLWPREFCLGE